MKKPDGTQLTSFVINGQSFLDATALPATGTYTVNIQPAASGTTTITGYTFSQQSFTTTEGGSQVPITIASPGQNATVTFSGSAGDAPYLFVNGAMNGACNGTVYKPDATTLTTFNCASANSTSLGPLTQNGTYSILIDPQSLTTGTVTLQLGTPVTGGTLASGVTTLSLIHI